MYPSHADLRRAQRFLRRYDNALRLRHSQLDPHILVERKTFRGLIGANIPDPTLLDSGIRRELGHVHVAAIHDSLFDLMPLFEALKSADSWKKAPLADRVEARERQAELSRKRRISDDLRYKAANLFDNYVWRYKQRVSVPVDIA